MNREYPEIYVRFIWLVLRPVRPVLPYLDAVPFEKALFTRISLHLADTGLSKCITTVALSKLGAPKTVYPR